MVKYFYGGDLMRPEVGKILTQDQVNYVRYGDSDSPQKILGRHFVDQGQVITYFHPYAKEAVLDFGEECYDMENIEHTNVFSVYVPHKKEMQYRIHLRFDDDSWIDVQDPYSFKPQLTKKQITMWEEGKWLDAYRYLGAHPMTIGGVSGTYFAVWAPNAKRVSVVGDFNHWDGRVNSMIRRDGGIFELFIPDVWEDMLYKYEIKTQLGEVFLKSDPFANAFEVAPKNASMITDFDGYQWNDKRWMEERKEKDIYRSPVIIYEVHLGSWKREGEYYLSYEELAKQLVSYMADMGYTHLELLGIPEYLRDETMGQEVYGFFAPTSRYGKIKDFKYFIDYLHQNGIGVILEWSSTGMTKDPAGMTGFDGTALFESTKESHQKIMRFNTAPFDYSKKQVYNYMFSNAMFWMNEFHIDGFCVSAKDCRIYENFDQETNHIQCFLAKFIDAVNSQNTGCIVITEFMENNCIKEKNATFHWMESYANRLIHHLQKDNYFKRKLDSQRIDWYTHINHGEKNIIKMPDYFGEMSETALETIPGDYFSKFANMRMIYGFLIGMCGKKHVFMGHDIALWNGWDVQESLDWNILNEEANEQFQQYEKRLFHFYISHKVLYEEEYFTWLLKPGSNEIFAFSRKDSERDEDTDEELVFVCNFTPIDYEAFTIGIRGAKKYKQVFSSDEPIYGGLGTLNNEYVETVDEECNGFSHSLTLQLPRQSIIVLEKRKE